MKMMQLKIVDCLPRCGAGEGAEGGPRRRRRGSESNSRSADRQREMQKEIMRLLHQEVLTLSLTLILPPTTTRSGPHQELAKYWLLALRLPEPSPYAYVPSPTRSPSTGC